MRLVEYLAEMCPNQSAYKSSRGAPKLYERLMNDVGIIVCSTTRYKMGKFNTDRFSSLRLIPGRLGILPLLGANDIKRRFRTWTC